MADARHTTRRTFLKALGLATAGASVSTIAVAEAVRPTFVKVGSPSFSISQELAEAIDRWNRAKDAKAVAWQAWESTWRVKRDGKWIALHPSKVDLVEERRAHAVYVRAGEDEQAATRAMLKLLRKSEVDVPAIYHG